MPARRSFTPISYVPGYRELALHPYGILKAVVDANAFVKGEWRAEIVDDIAPQERDVILEGKRGLTRSPPRTSTSSSAAAHHDDRTERLS